MTKEYMEKDGTFSPATGLNQEIQQFRRLKAEYPDLDDKEYAHRLVTTEKQIQKMRKILGE